MQAPKHRATTPLARADYPGRVWGGKQTTSGVDRSMLPKSHAKYRARPGSQAWGNGPKEARPDQMWKFWDSFLGKYIYASSRPKGSAGKGWVKA